MSTVHLNLLLQPIQLGGCATSIERDIHGNADDCRSTHAKDDRPGGSPRPTVTLAITPESRISEPKSTVDRDNPRELKKHFPPFPFVRTPNGLPVQRRAAKRSVRCHGLLGSEQSISGGLEEAFLHLDCVAGCLLNIHSEDIDHPCCTRRQVGCVTKAGSDNTPISVVPRCVALHIVEKSR